MTGDIVCSIVIRAYNEEQHIGRLLSGIAQQNLHQQSQTPQLEIILVDSGSTDATIAIASSFATRLTLRVVNIEPEEFSFGRSLNRGIAQAKGDLIVIASAHVYPTYPDWLEQLLAPLKDPQVALCYGKQRGGPYTHFSEHQVFARWFPEHSDFHQSHPFCNNANAVIRRSLWKTHPYDETLSGLEDLAWAIWAASQGYAIAYAAEAETIHIHDETPRAVYNRYRREAMAFKRLFPHESFHLGDLLVLVTGNIFSDMRQAVKQDKLVQSWRSILWFRWMQFWGTYQGYHHSGPLTRQLRQTFYYPPSSVSTSSAGATSDGDSRQISSHPKSRRVEPIRYNE
jgi:glycosyltransferase involved in cell wall biosynthesis